MGPPGLLLDVALETSWREASLAIGVNADGDETLLLDEIIDRPGGAPAHASDLLPRLAVLLTRLGVEPGAGPLPLRALFVGTGPGSYTGLRVGIATAQGLARATGATLHGIPSFAALAWSELAPGEEGAVVADARAGRFYHARYRRLAHDVQELEPPHALDALAFAERCRSSAGPLFAPPGVAEAAGLTLAPGRLRTHARPRAEAVLALGRARLAAGAEAQPGLEPLYLRSFGARAPG